MFEKEIENAQKKKEVVKRKNEKAVWKLWHNAVFQLFESNAVTETAKTDRVRETLVHF